MKKFAAIGALRVADERQPVFVLDHDIQNESEENLAKYDAKLAEIQLLQLTGQLLNLEF